jgi:prolipoprotein diacylglyceryltransferase
MAPLLTIGPLSIPLPSLTLLLGFWLGSMLAEKKAKEIHLDGKFIENALWSGLVAGLIGARLSYLARFPNAFRGDWLSILSLNPAFLDVSSGVLIAGAAVFLISARQQFDTWKLLDSLVPFFAVLLLSFHLASFFRGTGFGTPTDLPWGIELWGERRHPAQLYYSLAAAVQLVAVLYYFPKTYLADGIRFSILLSSSSFYLLILNKFQVASQPTLGRFRLEQVLFWFALLVGLILLNIRGKNQGEIEYETT